MALTFQNSSALTDNSSKAYNGPSLAVHNKHLYAAWRAQDENIWYSVLNSGIWDSPKLVNAKTTDRPALASMNGVLYMVWKGGTDKGNDHQKIWYATLTGNVWATQTSMPDPIRTTVGPSLAVWSVGSVQALFAAWKGGTDERIYYSTFDGSKWTPQNEIPGPVACSNGPSLAYYANSLFAAWKGGGSDKSIWYAFFNGNTWSWQYLMPGPIGSDFGPSLVVFKDILYAAWHGQGQGQDDQKICYTMFGPQGFGFIPNSGLVQKIVEFKTSHGPSMAVFDSKIYFAWKGSGLDIVIYWTTATTAT